MVRKLQIPINKAYRRRVREGTYVPHGYEIVRAISKILRCDQRMEEQFRKKRKTYNIKQFLSV